MLAVNDRIKNAYNQYTTQRKSKIRVGNNEYFIQNMDLYADAYDEGNIVGNAIAKILKFDIETEYISGLDEFELLDGIWTGEEYEYINLGTFKLFEEQGTDDFFSSVTAYDKLILFNEVFNPNLVEYPTTIYELLENVCVQAGVTLATEEIANGTQVLPGNIFVEGESLKDILRAICEISGTYAVISQDTLKLKLVGEESIVLEDYQLSSPEYKRTTWKVNQVVLGMENIDGEYVQKQDDEDVELNGAHKIVINNNPFVYSQALRQQYIDELFEQLKGFGYFAYETEWEGLPYVELGDMVRLGKGSYTINLGDIELCKIGNYQDRIYKENDNWYLEKKVGKYAIDTSSIILRTYNNVYYASIPKATDYAGYNNYSNVSVLSNKASYVLNWTADDANNIDKIISVFHATQWWIGFDVGTSISSMQSALTDCYIIYPLSTPTVTQITDELLISQLNDAEVELFGETTQNGTPTLDNPVPVKNKTGKITVENIRKSIVLRYEIKSPNGLDSSLQAPSIIDSVIDYVNNTDDLENKQRRTEYRVDKAEGTITQLTETTTELGNKLTNDYYTITQTNELIQTSATGITNTFSEAGGNNIFRNTGLWFSALSTEFSLFPSVNIYPSENTFMGMKVIYEFWNGDVTKIKEEKAANMIAMRLLKGDFYQEQTVPNGNYTVSFKYKKLIELANPKVRINDIEYRLSNTDDTEFVENIEVNSNHINVLFTTDIDDSCEIYDLMVNAGKVKLAYSQNQNETTTDTVNISKGITITSTNTDTTFKANADGIRTLDKNENVLTQFTDTGMTTKKMIVEDTSVILGTQVQEVGGQTWFTRL